MNGETSAPLYIGTASSSRKKRRRDRNGEPSRGKPVSKKWKPVWLWLQSLKRTEIVEPSEVITWLDSNPAYAAEIRQHHTNGVFVAYAQKCHQRLIFGQYHNKVDTKKNPVSRPMRPPRLTNDAENSNGQMGTKAITERSQKGHQDLYHLQWNQHLAHNVEHGEDEGSILDPETWRVYWREYLGFNKNSKIAQVEIDAEVNPEQRHSSSPHSTRINQQQDPDNRVQNQREKEKEPQREPNLEPVDKMDTITEFELMLDLEMRLKEIVSNSKRQPFESDGVNDGARIGRKRRVGSDTTKTWVYSVAPKGVGYSIRCMLTRTWAWIRRWQQESNLLSMDALRFGSDKLLIYGGGS